MMYKYFEMRERGVGESGGKADSDLIDDCITEQKKNAVEVHGQKKTFWLSMNQRAS